MSETSPARSADGALSVVSATPRSVGSSRHTVASTASAFPRGQLVSYASAFEGVVATLWERMSVLERRAEAAEARCGALEEELSGGGLNARVAELEGRVQNLAHNIQGFSAPPAPTIGGSAAATARDRAPSTGRGRRRDKAGSSGSAKSADAPEPEAKQAAPKPQKPPVEVAPAYDSPEAAGVALEKAPERPVGAQGVAEEDIPVVHRGSSMKRMRLGRGGGARAAGGAPRRSSNSAAALRSPTQPSFRAPPPRKLDYRKLWRRAFAQVKLSNRMNSVSMLDRRGGAGVSLVQRVQKLEGSEPEHMMQIEALKKQIARMQEAMDMEDRGAPGSARHLVTLLVSMLGSQSIIEAPKDTITEVEEGKGGDSGSDGEQAGASPHRSSSTPSPVPSVVRTPAAEVKQYPLAPSIELFIEDREDLMGILDDMLVELRGAGADPGDGTIVGEICEATEDLNRAIDNSTARLRVLGRDPEASLSSDLLLDATTRGAFEDVVDLLNVTTALFEGDAKVMIGPSGQRVQRPPLRYRAALLSGHRDLTRMLNGLNAHHLSIVAAKRLNELHTDAAAGAAVVRPFQKTERIVSVMRQELKEAEAARAATDKAINDLLRAATDAQERLDRLEANSGILDRTILDVADVKQKLRVAQAALERLDESISKLESSGLSAEEARAMREAHAKMSTQLSQIALGKADKEETQQAVALVTDAIKGLTEEQATLAETVGRHDDALPLKVNRAELEAAEADLRELLGRVAKRAAAAAAKAGAQNADGASSDAAMISRLRPRCLSCNRPLKSALLPVPARPPGFDEDEQNAFRPGSPTRTRTGSDALRNQSALGHASTRPSSAAAGRSTGRPTATARSASLRPATAGASPRSQDARRARPQSAAARSAGTRGSAGGPGYTASEAFARMTMTVPAGVGGEASESGPDNFPARPLGAGPRTKPSTVSAASVPQPRAERMVLRQSTASNADDDALDDASASMVPPESPERRSPVLRPGNGSGARLAPLPVRGRAASGSTGRSSRKVASRRPAGAKPTHAVPTPEVTHAVNDPRSGEVEEWGSSRAQPSQSHRHAAVSSYQRVMPGKKLTARR